MPWAVEDHTADVQLRVEAPSWSALLEEAAAAFAGFVTGGAPPRTAVRKMQKLQVGAAEPVEAWVQWWRGLLRLWSVEGLLAVSAGVSEDAAPAHTSAVLRCIAAEELDLAALTDVKAVTRHRAEAAELAEGGWRGRIVLDV